VPGGYSPLQPEEIHAMQKLKIRVLASTCALVAGTAAFAPNAFAYNAGDIFGGGASVPAPYARQTFDCYANPTQLIITGTPPTFQTIPPFNYTGSPPQNCATQHIVKNETTYYMSASAGVGILAAFSHDPTFFGYVDSQDSEYWPEVTFGMSTTSLVSADASVYNNGGIETEGKSSITIAAPGGEPCNGGKAPYPNPLQCYGPLVQFPFAITPIVFAYNSTYEKVLINGNEVDYHFHITHKNKDGSGGLRLSPTTYCKIFNGQITNWNDPAIYADNGKKSLRDPSDPVSQANWSVPLQIVGRSDSAGATSILERHLANVCASLAGNQYTTGASTLPSSLLGPTYSTSNPNYPPVSGETPGKFTLVSGNSGVAQYTAFTATPGGSNPSNCTSGTATACIQLGRITYSGSDYVLPWVLETQQNAYSLNQATLQNASGAWEEATPKSSLAAYTAIQPPQSNKNGTYCASCLNFGYRNDPTAWVQSTSPTSLIADPTAKTAYPIVGTANWIAYTCYASKSQQKSLVGVMKYIDTAAINTDTKLGILSSAGLSPLSKQWRNAINTSFVNNNSGLGLNIEPAGAPGACSASGIVGG
jgi:phosphate transport system substrate-binding protein